MHAFFLLIFIFPEASSVRFFLSPSFLLLLLLRDDDDDDDDGRDGRQGAEIGLKRLHTQDDDDDDDDASSHS
jgi:hypothetical protein